MCGILSPGRNPCDPLVYLIEFYSVRILFGLFIHIVTDHDLVSLTGQERSRLQIFVRLGTGLI